MPDVRSSWSPTLIRDHVPVIRATAMPQPARRSIPASICAPPFAVTAPSQEPALPEGHHVVGEPAIVLELLWIDALVRRRHALEHSHPPPRSSPGQATRHAVHNIVVQRLPSRARGMPILSPPAVACDSSPRICSRRRGRSRRSIERDEIAAMRSA